MNPDQADAIGEIAILAEPVRRALYAYVSDQPDAVGRDAAAAALGIGRPLAAFHLDRLVEAGLLDVSFRRLSGRSGPGAGRPAKLYRRSGRDVSVSVPARRYELAASLFAEAIASGGPGDGATTNALAAAARRYGESLGEEARRRAGPRPARAALLAAALEVLAEAGFEPIASAAAGDLVALRNCPFDAIARTQQAVVCGMNLSLMDGVIAGLRARGIAAELDPQPGMCCVVWRRR